MIFITKLLKIFNDIRKKPKYNHYNDCEFCGAQLKESHWKQNLFPNHIWVDLNCTKCPSLIRFNCDKKFLHNNKFELEFQNYYGSGFIVTFKKDKKLLLINKKEINITNYHDVIINIEKYKLLL